MSDKRALHVNDVEPLIGASYPAPYDAPCAEREKRKLGNVFDLTAFGVNEVRMAPGVWSSQRHWHTKEDEFIYILEGELVLVTDAGEQTLSAGMFAGFPAGVMNGHHLINKSDADAVYLEVGSRVPGDSGEYPDVDLRASSAGGTYSFTRKDGTPY